MDAIYIEYHFQVFPKEPATEILIAQLSFAGFESFVENEEDLIAYIQKQDWHPDILKDIFIFNSDEFKITFTQNEITKTNWNEEWEKNFSPIQINNLVSIRAPFHNNKPLLYDIIVVPKMSFGTGHHETTHMMIQYLLATDLQNKKVLDMGCGTGILAIFSEIKGASSIDAIDIDPWCYENSLENIQRNNCQHISVKKGDASLLPGNTYDLILANINRNILLADMKRYTDCLDEKGILLLSGFYQEDISIIDKEVVKYGLTFQKKIIRNRWAALKYLK
ncbi:MAG: Ribosomal protein L11 methyltransferase [Flavobacterium sp. SCGC AAA160-P02]|nr:MAG: Ribosomal protein L11 methyltransferase [Flavobacterium sp. SCGC AAA160-P02]